jgi:hypothetical protein
MRQSEESFQIGSRLSYLTVAGREKLSAPQTPVSRKCAYEGGIQ